MVHNILSLITMNKKKSGSLTTFVITIALVFSSCINDKRYFVDAETFKTSDLEIIKLAGTIIEFNDTIWNPVGIDVKDTLLFLKNHLTEYVYDVYNLNNNEKINECLTIGQGPDEFIYPIIAQSMDTGVWIFDRGKARLKEYLVSDLLSKRHPVSIKDISLRNNASENVAVLPNGNIVASVNLLPAGGFDLYDSKGIFLDSIGKFPEFTSGTLSATEKVLFFRSKFTTNLINRIFVSYLHTDLIEIYDYEGNLIKRIHGPHQYQLVMTLHSGGGVSGASTVRGQTRACYTSPVHAGNEVFVLYCGELWEEYQERFFKIIVFDWDGKPLRMYELDTHLFTFTVDSEHKIIYGITNSPELRIIKFNY